MKYSLYIFASVVVCFVFAWSQEKLTPMGQLTVTSNRSGARVFVDSVDLGFVPLVSHPLPPGRHVICVVPAPDKSWMIRAVCRETEINSGKEIHIPLDIHRYIRVTSEPYGARVLYRDSLVGETPCIVRSTADRGTITLIKVGYESATLMFHDSTLHLYAALNSKQWSGTDPSTLYLDKEESRTIVPIVVTASSAVLTGVAAAYWKIRADNLYSEYRATGNPDQLTRIRKLDVASGISLGVSQVSLALLTYFLLSR